MSQPYLRANINSSLVFRHDSITYFQKTGGNLENQEWTVKSHKPIYSSTLWFSNFLFLNSLSTMFGEQQSKKFLRAKGEQSTLRDEKSFMRE